MPNYRKRNNNNRNKNKNKNKSTSSSSVKQDIRVVESTTVTTTTTPGIEPNLPADARNSYTASAEKSVFEEKNVVVVVNVDEAFAISPLSNEEIDENASNVDIDTFSGSEDTILKQSNYSSTFYSSSSSSKKSTEIEDRQLNRAVFNIGDSTLGDSVIRETFAKEVISGKNSLKTGSANSKDAAVSAADKPAATMTQPIESTRINESVSEKVRNVSEQRSKSTESATEVVESNNQSSHFSSKENYSSKVIVQTDFVKNDSEKSVSQAALPTSVESSTVIVHQISKEDPKVHKLKSQVIVNREEQSSSASSSHRASKHGVDLSKKTSTKAAESSTTQTLSFSNVRGQPSRQIIYDEPRKVIVDNFPSGLGPSRAIIHQISKEEGFENVNQSSSKVIVHQISREENQRSSSSNESVITQHILPQTTDYKLIVHQILPSGDRSKGSQASSPRSAESCEDLEKNIDHSVFQKSFAENISKGFNIDQKDHDIHNISKKNTLDRSEETQAESSDKSRKVILIPILQENSTQTSPLPSFNEKQHHSNLLEIIKDENSETKPSTKSEFARQTSSSPLSRSPVICFENLSKSFELNKDQSEDSSKSIGNTAENSPKIIEHPIVKKESTEAALQSNRKSPQRAENLEPLKIPSFPLTRPAKVIVHPIINEKTANPVFPLSKKSMETIDSSSKKIANKILKEVSSELKSSFLSENIKDKIEKVEKVYLDPIRTSFPVSLKNQASFRPGFFETDIFQKEINPLDREAKVIVHKISTNGQKGAESQSKPDDLYFTVSKSTEDKFGEKVIVHKISQQESIKSHSKSYVKKESSSSSFPVSGSFPISVEKERHAAQYTARPQDSQQKIIDLQSLRDSAEFRQSSSTMTSTYGLTEMENKKETVQQELNETPTSDLQEPAINKPNFPSSSGLPSNGQEIPALGSEKEVHQISREESHISRSESKEARESYDSISKSDLKHDKPKVILHQISRENTTLSRSPSFPLANEINGETVKKDATNLRDCFPLSAVKIHHPEQYNSKSTVLEQKTINFKKLRDESKLNQSSATMTSPYSLTLMKERKDQTNESNSPGSSHTPFPLSAGKEKQSSFTTKPIFQEKLDQSSCPPSSFPCSAEKQTHATQYAARPQDSQQKTIDLQSLRDSAEFRQSSSTMTSTYGLTEMENKKEIIHQILKEKSPSDLQKPDPEQPGSTSSSGLPKHTAENLSTRDHLKETIDHQSKQETSDFIQSSSTKATADCTKEKGTNKDRPKEIVHPILRETSSGDLQPQSPNQQKFSTKEGGQSSDGSILPKVIIHQIVREDSSRDIQPQTLDHQTSQDESISSSEGSVLTAIYNESPRSISPPITEAPKTKESSEEQAPKRSFFLAPLELPNKTQSQTVEMKQGLQMISPEFVKVFNHPVVRQIEKPLGYRVESPQPEKIPMIVKKSKSFDDDDVVIQEMSDTSSAGDTDNPPVISEAESETDTIEAVDDISEMPTCSSLLSIQTLPINLESDNLSPKSSQEYKSRRQQNRAALESHFLPQFLAPNFLDSIKEENSDLSDSDRRSSCSDRVDAPVHHGDLDDDVFLDPPKKANAVYPKSNLDFSKKHKHVLNVCPPKTSVIREEASPPSVVEAKIIDQGMIEESCSSWSTDLTPESEAAEVVYIDSASSSVSDLLELDYSQGQPDDSIDVRIQTPTIDLESVNEMFANCQQIESNDGKIFIPPSEKPPPPPPVNDNADVHSNLNEGNLLPSHNKNDLPDTTKLKLENEKEKCKILDEIISEKIETISEAAGDTHKSSASTSATAISVSAENSIANNLNSCDSAIDQIATSNTSPSVSAASAVVVVGSIKNMENIREIVNSSAASSKSESDEITDRTDHGFLKTNFMIGQPCSDHTLKCDTNSSSSSSSSTSSSTTTNTTTTTTTKILTLHDLSQTLDSTKHLNNPFVSPSSSALDRQESLDSHGSDQSQSTNQSQCTAINQGSLPNCEWNEFDTSTDTTYVSESDTAAGLASSEASSTLTSKGAHTSGDETESPPIRKLRSLCTEALASMPYGEEVLQELATVAETIRDMPYPLPDLPQIQDIQLSLGSNPQKTSSITLSQVPPRPTSHSGQKFKSPPPPPVPEPPSKYDAWLGVPSESDPNILVCLSPSQRNAVKSDSTADSLLDMHKKFVERRGYHEYTTKQVNAINQANISEAPKLSKVDSPPPPPLPPRPPTQLSNPNGNTDINDFNDDEEDQNNHRLLAIIRDTHESHQQQHQQQKSSMTSTSENTSRRTESGIHNTVNTGKSNDGANSRLEKEFANTPCSVNKQSQERKFISESNKSDGGEMHQSESEHSTKIGGETVMGMKFPTSEYFDSIFDGKNKRFSNIETSIRPEFCSQILATQPKRYSNIETSSFESKKCVENGKVLYDVSDSKREKISEGDLPDSSSAGSAIFPDLSKAKTNGLEGSFPSEATANRSTAYDSRPQTGGDSENIMSAFKLNTTQTTAPPAAANRVESSPPAPPVPPLPTTLTADTTATSSTRTTKSTSTSESHINRTFNAKMSEKTFDDIGQRAKEAAATTTSNTNESSSSSTDKKPSDAFHHEKLFKEFDELSNLLKDELESGKRRPPATLNGNDIPSNVIDYNRVARESKIQNSHVSSTTSNETNRREQMKKLAEEIDLTSRHKLQQRREMRIPIVIEKSAETGPRSAPVLTQEPRSYEIPVRVESGHSIRPNLQHQRSYEIPVRVEQTSKGSRPRTYSEHQSQPRTHEIPIQVEKPQPDRFRRAESMFNISDSTESRHHLHHDDWMKYVGDLGSSENICKPFQREVEICYLGRRPNIRAPRMSASTSDLSSIHTFDTHGAYDVRRTAQTPRPQQPPRRAYLSTQSLIDTTPITPCVSARRSPAPQRRSSLPREIHDKQLEYITSKEQQLKYEFERLENERRHLVDEMNRVQMNQRISREAYRQRQLPPLTEDESFRQQMAEEWLHKVAEREERRLQKIIKISKINQEAGVPVAPPRRHSAADDIGDEFLRRVKERRSKLCMPSDSDWESGAESQPLPRTDGSRSENEEPPVTVFEGQSTTNIKQLPKHLREFAKLTSQMKEEHREEMTENTSTSASKMTALKTTVKTTNNNHSTQESQSMQQDAAHVRDLEQQLLSHNGKRPKLVTILRHRKPAECGGSGGASNCQQSSCSNTNSAIKRRKQTRFLLTPNRRSWSESDLLREIDKELVLAKGFLYANVFSVKNEYMSEPETEYDKPKKMAQLSRRQYDGIGPTTKHGMPVILRSEVKEPNQHEWYKRIFQTIHKQKNPDDYVTIRYKCPRGRYPYKANGYMSEPEPNYDSDYSTVKYRNLERRRLQSTGGTESRTSAVPTGNENQDETFYGTMPNPVKSGQGSYKVQPGRIENYITGHSSVSEKEKKEQLDQQKLSPHYTEGNLSRALLKEQGYTSDSNLVFRKKDVPILQSPLSPVEQKQVYKSVQAGGQPPLLGFRKPAPEKPKESPNRYFESDVNIHYKTPIRYEYKDPIPEEELAIRQAETMQKLYQEERRRKYLQELQDMNSRRHTDNFTPSQKSPIPLNRYDDFNSDLAPKSPNTSNYPRTVARALYNFQGQTARELTFKKGDVIYIRRQIDKNWYEGEHNAMIGLLPSNYVELLTKDGIRQPPKKPSEGQARAKYNFQAQSGIELSLNKGEHVTLTRRVDENWYEGKIANRKGIFPVSYVEVLVDIGAEDKAGRLPATQSIITHSSSSMRPSLDTLRTNINNEFNSLTSNGQPPNGILRETRTLHKTEVLHVDTNTEPVAYRALYKYRPQNTDELELQEGDIVFVLEKCDDGWFVGTSQRSGCFGTFPGNYVERV